MLTALSVCALGIVLLVTFVGVIMRYVFASPILGSNEIIQLTSIALIMLAMPLAAQKEIHVRVDVFDKLIGGVGRFAGDIFSRAVGTYILAMLGMRAWDKLLEVAEFGDSTNMLQIPIWPFYALLVLGAVLYAIVLVLQGIDIVRHGVSRDD